MPYWVFNQEQLNKALTAWEARRAAEGRQPQLIDAAAVVEFLCSPEATEHKLIVEEKR
jgi:hypothetical protein